MIDYDYAPGVFAGMIVFAIVCPTLYGIFLVDAHWKRHSEEVGNDDDVFN